MIERVTFTGVDEHSDVERMTRIAGVHRFAEFAVLAGSSTGQHPRFPSLTTIERFREHASSNGLHAAIHLCGRLARAVRDGDLTTATTLGRGFERMQINLPRENRAAGAARASELAAATGCRIIVQHDGPWSATPRRDDDHLEYLFDASGGRGEEAFGRWPQPPAGSTQRWGYAGGVGPETIHQALAFAGRHEESRLWFDMESGVRTQEVFDLDKVEQVCERVKAWKRERAAAAAPASNRRTSREPETRGR